MAGMPREIVRRATDILAQLESQHIESDSQRVKQAGSQGTAVSGADAGAEEGTKGAKEEGPAARSIAASSFSQPAPQLSIFETVDPTAGRIKAALEEININNMTPIECMMKLNELRGLLEE
jgi:DNA mismatch repair protein MutS